MARKDNVWEVRLGTYIETVAPNWYDVLINGSNHYLNFGTVSWNLWYGFRDNWWSMEFKDSGWSWSVFWGWGGGSIVLKTNWTNNGSQTILDLIQGSNITLTDDWLGGVTIDATWGSWGWDVVWPTSAINNRVVFFDWTTGKLIKDSGLTLSWTNTGDQDLSPYFNKSVDDTDDITEGTTKKFTTSSDISKLAGIEALADVTDATNVGAAWAFMKSVDDTDDINVWATNKFATAAEKTKLSNITVTQPVDLDTLESDTATNNAKVTNATHTGEVTGSWALTLDSTAITNKTAVTAVWTDYVLISDTSDSGNLKKALVSDFVGWGGTWWSITGTLSSQTDLQTALDWKVDENVAITGATKTKITYDAKGLVTSGADATTADIADSSNKRYVTDAQLTVIGNTSWTNTGDQTSIVGITGTKAQFNTAVSDWDIVYTDAIGSTVQAYDSDLTTWAGITPWTGVWTALAINVGSAWALVTNGGALGTPSSWTLTNATGLPIAGLTASTSTALWVGGIELWHATDTTIARVSAWVISVEWVTVPTISSTSTITNKRNQPRIVSATSYTTDTGTSLDVSTCDIFVVTAQAWALLFNNPSGTPVQWEKLMIRIKDNWTARALTYGSQFRASSDLALPTTTVLSKTLYMGFIYNSTDTKRDLLAVLNNF